MKKHTLYKPVARRDWRPYAVAAALTIIAISATTLAIANETCESDTAALSEVNDKYRNQFKQLETDGDDLKKDAVTFDMDIGWKDVEIIFDLPTATTRDQKFIFGLPQTKMGMQEFIFGTPSSRMVPHKVGQYPEFYCDTGTFIPKCSVKWSDIVTNIPEVFMQEQRIKTLVPEFFFTDTEVIIGIPEFSWARQRLVVGLPQFTVRSLAINSSSVERRGNELSQRAEALKVAQAGDSTAGVQRLYACYRQTLQDHRAAAEKKFDSSILLMDAVIDNLRSQGADPASVKTGTGETENLVAKRDVLVEQKAHAVAEFASAQAQLDAGETKTMANMSGDSPKENAT